MNGPAKFVKHLADNLYHPRSDAHSNAICLAVLDDLLQYCEEIAASAASGRLVAKINHNVTVGHDQWNIDLALGPPTGSPEPPPSGEKIRFGTPAVVEIAVEAKAVMTEHSKAQRNRLRDLRAFHHHAHVYDNRVIAVGIVAVNAATTFWSPTRSAGDITTHKANAATKAVEVFKNLPLRNSYMDPAGLEALAVLVVRHDNLGKNNKLPASAPAAQPTSLVTAPPAPQPGDPLHYATMIRRVCRSYASRWGSSTYI